MTPPSAILLQGGHVIDPSRDLDGAADVLIQDGKIASVGRGFGRLRRDRLRDNAAAVVMMGAPPSAHEERTWP